MPCNNAMIRAERREQNVKSLIIFTPALHLSKLSAKLLCEIEIDSVFSHCLMAKSRRHSSIPVLRGACLPNSFIYELKISLSKNS